MNIILTLQKGFENNNLLVVNSSRFFSPRRIG
jgi:hypothetical protein